MRPVNLIPPESRQGDRAPMRTGGVSYAVIAALGLAMLGVIAVAFTGKSISDREAEVTQLNQQLQTTTAKAQSLSAFAEFGAVEQLRAGTISSLAQSRFDWERVMNELALVIPADVWLVELAGTVTPGAVTENGPDIQLRDSVNGPALEIVGCATGQDAVAGFASDLEDIDGVTRVGVASSERPEDALQAAGSSEAATTSGSDGTGGECRTEDFIARFEIVVAFDEVPVPGTATAAPTVPAPLAPGAATGSGEVAEVQGQQAANSAEVAQSAGEAEQAPNVIPGG